MSEESQISKRQDALLHIQPGTADDNLAAHNLFLDSVWDLAWRMGLSDGERVPSQEQRAASLQQWQPLFDHLSATCDQYWVAKRDGQLLGFARSIVRDGVRELTEFFVAPQAQSDGIGRELLARAMPPGARHSYIVATPDLRAQALYHKSGHFQICAVYTFSRERKDLTPPEVSTPHDIIIDPIRQEHLPMLGMLDKAIHGYFRDVDHKWFMQHRSGFILFRDQRAIGYGYVGDPFSGPFVMLDENDFPFALAHAERIAMEREGSSLAFDVPMLNRVAIQYLLARRYRMSGFFCFYMCNHLPLNVHKTIITSPMIMV
jgi:GNAT superfamily N-acetyltransferase